MYSATCYLRVGNEYTQIISSHRLLIKNNELLGSINTLFFTSITMEMFSSVPSSSSLGVVKKLYQYAVDQIDQSTAHSKNEQ